MAYSGEMQWRTRAGDEIAARLGEPLTKDLTAQALRTALDPAGSWMPSVLAAADTRLSEVRRHVPDAGGLVIATDQDSARAYAKLLARDHRRGADRGALRREGRRRRRSPTFTEGDARWMVAVRMVSEGVDVPRLAVGVYATTTSTPLFFAQAVGRFVRARSRGETASVFLPSVPSLLGFASEMEVERDHVLGRKITDEDDIFAAEDDLLAQAQRRRGAPPTSWTGPSRRSGPRRASTGCSTTAASSATRARCTSARRRRWTSSASPACSSPTRCASCCSSGRATGPRSRSRRPRREPDTVAEVSTHEQLAVLRRELNGLVAAWHHRTGQAHGITHAALRKECGGPAAAVATADQLHARIDRIREWAARKTS